MIEVKDVIIPLDDYSQINNALIRKELRSNRGQVLWCLFGLVFLTVYFLLLCYQYTKGEINAPIIPGIILLISLAIPWLILRRMRGMLRKQYASLPIFLSPTTYQLTNTSILIFGPNEVNRTELQWSTLQRAWRFKHWLLVFGADNTAFYLDVNRLTPPNQLPDLLQFLHDKGIPVDSSEK